MPVRSLVDLASIACIKNIRHLESVGDYLPYENVRHILLRVENAHQLRRIEVNSPQIEGRTGEIWLKLIERDFPLEFRAKAYKPQNPNKWFKVWEKYKRDHDRSVEESEKQLKSALAGLQQDRAKNTSMIVERKLLPRNGATGKKRHWSDGMRSSLNFTSGSKTKTSSGASVMRRVRREATEIASIKGSLSRSIGLPPRHPELRAAPQSMIDDRRRAAQPSNAPSAATPKIPKVPAVVTEHEERATFISDSEGDDDDDDALFDEPPRKRVKPMSRPMATSTPRAVAGNSTRSAAASLLKTKPAVATSSRPISSTAKAPSSSSSGLKAMFSSAASSRSPNKPLSKPSTTEKPVAEASSYRVQTSPISKPNAPHISPATSPPLPAAASPPARPAKRKAPSIFMKPRKRAI